ncbi:endonuclease YncB(thermonuclease family) [Litorimonas taeanensis]|uniref:Endonuclease YncB(Thermonuclease family) n=1 Tax=Litorimonas taeanensis TaxID=568099 RepID=A0A420WD72_9PROT|nr:thermonuclease family protein [Litorimonas taeanensis]RKQ68928.1 endonuclease YncB(thermonuclease family) [Litorimonas taeanensis]
MLPNPLKVGKSCPKHPRYVQFYRRPLGKIWAIAFSLTAACSLFSVGAKAAPISNKPPGYWVTVDRVVDGDTFWAEGIKYRLVDIDTPETSADKRHGYKCDAERRLGELATAEAEILLLNRKVWIKPSGSDDRYGRKLVKVRYAYGQWYGEHMIKSRLAARWQGRKHAWCKTQN